MSKAMSSTFPEPSVPVARESHSEFGSRFVTHTGVSSRSHATSPAFVGAVSCPICTAVYTPDVAHEQLLHAPAIALESAFMSMCRFCFRCRRPACPACWDVAHELCSACVQELGLPARQELVPFTGALPMPSLHITTRSASSTSVPGTAPLRCVYAGQFQQVPLPTSSPQEELLQETGPVVAARPGKRRSPGHVTTLDDIEVQVTRPTSTFSSRKHVRSSRRVSPIKRIANIILFALLIAMSALILLVVVVMFSPQANSWIAHMSHIDGHALIIKVWSFVQRLLHHK
jgi:hypothetical protein